MKTNSKLAIGVITTLLLIVVVLSTLPGEKPDQLKVGFLSSIQPINTISIDERGVYLDPASNGHNIIIFGHRTSHSAPFYYMDQLCIGDVASVTLDGETKLYKCTEISVVPSSYMYQPDTTDKLVLITCTPLGSDSHRLIATFKLVV